MHRRFAAAALGLVLLAAPAAAFAQEPQPPAGPWAASWDYLAQQPPGSQSILVHALGGQPQLPAALDQLEQTLDRGTGQGFSSAQELAEGVVALAKLEQDPTAYRRQNLVAALASYGDIYGEGLAGPCAVLAAYHTAGAVVDASARNDESAVIDYLVSSQQREGGFAPSAGRDPSIQTTAQALIALAPYAGVPYVGSAVERGLDWLGRQQNDDGSFSAGNTPSCAATAAVWTAVRTCGLPAGDPRFVKEGGGLPQALARFAQGNGGYGEQAEGPAQVAATEAALIALITDASGLSPYLPPAAYPGYVPPVPEPEGPPLWQRALAGSGVLLAAVLGTALLVRRRHKRPPQPPMDGTQTMDFQIPMKAQMPDFGQIPPTQDPPSSGQAP